MTTTVQFGHSNSERLLLTDFIFYEDGGYGAIVDLRCASFQGIVQAWGLKNKLNDFLQQLQVISKSMKGTVRFKNLEEQLRMTCSIGIRGNVTYEVEINDWMHKTLSAEFESDLSSLDAAIVDLSSVLQAQALP